MTSALRRRSVAEKSTPAFPVIATSLQLLTESRCLLQPYKRQLTLALGLDSDM